MTSNNTSNRSEPARPSNPAPRRKEPSLNPPAYVLAKHGGRVLDPSSAVRVAGQSSIRATVYVGSHLIVRTADLTDDVLLPLTEAARLADLKLGKPSQDDQMLDLARSEGLEDLALRVLISRISLLPLHPQTPSIPPDSWQVLQNYRSITGPKTELARKVTLDHLFNANAGIGGAGYMGGSSVGGTGYMGGSSTGGLGYMGGSGIGGPSFEYGMPGRGGRTPVTWLGPEPARRDDADLPCRRPVVAVLDTGTGKHPWLPASVVDRNPKVGALPIGMTDSLTNPEIHGSIDDPLEGVLDSDAGHGTFIAGLIRQTCPDATLLSVRVMHGDGAVPESQFLRSLNRLVLRQAIASHNGRPDLQIDVVSLSLGYYHELPSDEALDHQLLAPLAELGRLGVTVVAAAGNDATSRHMYPAGFAPHAGSPMPATRDRAPIVSVGALNPDRRTSALFSNAGDWVTCLRHGAAVVSTMPTALNGSLQASASIELPGGGRRSTIDPDDYFGGFATWSGTSFASPVLAGEIAQSLLSTGKLDEATPAKAVTRAWRAVSKLTGLSRPAGSAT